MKNFDKKSGKFTDFPTQLYFIFSRSVDAKRRSLTNCFAIKIHSKDNPFASQNWNVFEIF